MTKQELFKYIAAILTTLVEVDYAPASSIYMLFEMNMSKYELVRNIMVQADLIVCTSDTIKLTELGKSKALEINALTTA